MPGNQQILLDNRPAGEAAASNFKLTSTDTPALADGQVLVRHHFLSLDPYMRGRMNDSKGYTAPQALDVFESPRRVRTGFALRIKQRGLCKRQRHGSVYQTPLGSEPAAIAG